jgi:glycopeptide antibiotics resistance protein
MFIIARSAGTWAPYEPGIWAPTLIKPADVVRNVAIYIPFGVLGMLVLERRDARGVLRVMAIAVIFSLGVEALQLYTADRVASLTDIVSAGVGSCIGGAAIAWWRSPR